MILGAAMEVQASGGEPVDIAALRRRDPDAMTAVISQYQHRLFRYLVRLVADSAVAEDLFQSTWVQIIEKIARYDPRRSFEPWLFRVARNQAIDYLRRRRGESLDSMEEHDIGAARLASPALDALGRLLDFERSAMLAASLDGLPAIHREVLTLRFEEGMKLEEIAEVLGIPLPTVKSRLSRALEGLRAGVEMQSKRRRPHE
jgi:RNA polymerase sigma-70 factor (ECF subfamily)